ncbi:MAG: cytochrome c oxidase accessory protein CcoG [Gammaproteobacteria bacterium]|nr:cytochrome c oxidase accessory protein CcoG [Gammaproteobacteria bacterium]MBI5616290.1 cytochrome c oxidase accessory protein CcoG [Gammaproteobacteria bacterium]
MNQPQPLETPPRAKAARSDVNDTLYEQRQKVYPRQVHGLFASARLTTALVLLGIFYVMPWISWNGRQAILFDLPARKFYIFGLTFWPQDFLYLTFLLMLAAYSLFFFTALAGRLWCGYACPQTVWTDSFLWIERFVEGDRSKQMKLDQSPMSWRKFRIKMTKHALWIVFALFTGYTFVSYFSPATQLAQDLANFKTGPWETFWVLFYAFATYGNAGWMREQVCKYMCPYARFQSAMFDKDTLIISYDQARGEPRGSRRTSSDHKAQGLGDCIDCQMCVQVCPTGIDIRNGLQYECIGCSACVDVCDDVMEKVGYPKGLVKYTTQHAIDGGVTHVLRPRIILYGTVLVLLTIAFGYKLSLRIPIGLDVIRDRNQLYREVQNDIENVYLLKIINQDDKAHEYTLTADGIPGLTLTLERPVVHADGGSVLNLPVSLKAPSDKLTARSTPVLFTLEAKDDPKLKITSNAKFLGPRT